MRVLLGAQSCGFGPVSKLTAISRALDGHHRVCVGVTVASDFAQRNPDAYDEILELEPGDPALEQELARADWVVSVMNADLVFDALAADRPVLFVDSLLAFWQLQRTPVEIADLCARLRARRFEDWQAELGGLAPHEQIYAAHLCATASVAQNFPGVPERVEELRGLGASRPYLSGPIVDELGLSEERPAGDEPLDLLINLGGFKNFLLDYDVHNQYLELFSRWVPDLVARRPELRRVAVCGGGYGGPRARRLEVGEAVVTFECMAQRDFIAAVASARHYMLTPGLTAIHESVVLGAFPMALPEEHYGHVENLRALDGTRFGRGGARFLDLIEHYEIPEDDFEGTAAIVGHVARLLEDDGAYRRFAEAMEKRIDAYVSLDEHERAEGVAEIRTLLSGPSFASTLSEIIPSAHLDVPALFGDAR